MAEPLKALYDGLFIEDFGVLVRSVLPTFDLAGFTAAVRAGEWEELALKARSRRITEALGDFLPSGYEAALDVLMQIDSQCRGLPYIFFPDFVEVYGMSPAHFDRSMQALARFTRYSTGEFAVRPFLLAEPERMMQQMLIWADDEDEHVRRLASEGTRPRLPWAQALPMFKRDPQPILPLLDKLKADPSLYVRKSVANNLNDIAKDHPDVVVELAQRWSGHNPLTDWIIRRGCRTLVKQANPALMELFGYAAGVGEEGGEHASLTVHAELRAWPAVVHIGDEARISCEMKLRDGDALKLRIEYGIDFIKASGKPSQKRFLLSDREYGGGAKVALSRVHRFADLTTRKHYPGLHRITLWVNGVQAAETELQLEEADSK
ncbi:DNA alkylation repair protein [Paenibacillus algorifonticola]|uniref:DNA alkylation repair protein n=1 Tax=Paenibacillus algorifonticola TaxID=684063 RepID=UPI003D2E702D